MLLREKYINLFTDFGFKKIFGSEVNKDLLIDFLNTLLKDKEKIKDLTYKVSEHLGISEVDRKAIFDIFCENEKGEQFIVELQKVKQQFFKDRSVFYATFPVQEQAKTGNWDYKLKAVYCIAILDFTLDDVEKTDDSQEKKSKVPQSTLVVDEVKLISTKTNKTFYEKLTFVYVQIPNFKKTESELVTNEDKWFYVFKNLHRLANIPAQVQEEIFKKIFKLAEIAAYNEEEQTNYLNSLKYYLDLKNSIDYAKNTGFNEGIEKGKLETAIKMKQKGLSIEIIIECTGLSHAEIEKL